ncbi:MAG: toprim domain-containing protein [Ktedonobacterales bacterium]|nr:toprim domain-containing protein [Ktedonobacterales bacterium]
MLLRPPRRPSASEPAPATWQRDELATLSRWYPRTRERLQDERARAYLTARGIPWEIADGAGVGYVPADARLSGHMAKWRDRLIFPLASPAGVGYAGRTLAGWVPGMDEYQHKALLDSDPDGPRRWEKTYPAGWLGYGALAGAGYVVICEGPVDALALMASRLLDDVPVIALVGTAARAEWIPANVRGVVLALDGDAAGQERAQTLRHDLRAVGLAVTICAPAAEHGKDWAEAWRRVQHAGVWPISEAVDALAGAGDAVTPAEVVTPTPEPETGAGASLDALARADAVVRYLLAHGHELADVCAVAQA